MKRQQYRGASHLQRHAPDRHADYAGESLLPREARRELDIYVRQLVRKEIKEILSHIMPGEPSIMSDALQQAIGQGLITSSHVRKQPTLQQIAQKAFTAVKHFI